VAVEHVDRVGPARSSGGRHSRAARRWDAPPLAHSCENRRRRHPSRGRPRRNGRPPMTGTDDAHRP
jgi:hypothetical protein